MGWHDAVTPTAASPDQFINAFVNLAPSADEDQIIHWYCPLSDDIGLIRGWQNTLRDEFAEAEQPS
jgi:hypothetical protein